jgi:transposase
MARPSKYPDQFRREAVQMALATDSSSASVARRLGVNETTLRNWVKAHQAEEARAADPLSVSPSEFEELRRLRLENKELRMEKEILREAAAYFARETIRSAASGSSPTTGTPTASSGSAGSSASRAQASTRGRPARSRKGR